VHSSWRLRFFAAHAPRYCGTGWLDLPYPIDPFRNYQRLLVMIIPFGQPNAREIVRPHHADDDLPRYLGERGRHFPGGRRHRWPGIVQKYFQKNEKTLVRLNLFLNSHRQT
jgi:hypothetical protein